MSKNKAAYILCLAVVFMADTDSYRSVYNLCERRYQSTYLSITQIHVLIRPRHAANRYRWFCKNEMSYFYVRQRHLFIFAYLEGIRQLNTKR